MLVRVRGAQVGVRAGGSLRLSAGAVLGLFMLEGTTVVAAFGAVDASPRRPAGARRAVALTVIGLLLLVAARLPLPHPAPRPDPCPTAAPTPRPACPTAALPPDHRGARRRSRGGGRRHGRGVTDTRPTSDAGASRPTRRRRAPHPARRRRGAAPGRARHRPGPGLRGRARRQRRRDPRPTSSGSCPSRTRCSSPPARARRWRSSTPARTASQAIVWKSADGPRHRQRPHVRWCFDALVTSLADELVEGGAGEQLPRAASSRTGHALLLRLVELGAGLGAGDQRGGLGGDAAADLGARAPRAAPSPRRG